jgi:hypothetical protein
MTQINKDYPRGGANLWLERRRAVPSDQERYTGDGSVPYHAYDFTVSYPDNRSLLLAVDLLGPDTVGVEVGVYRAESFCTMLQVCKNVKTLYGVDPWISYHDKIGGGAMKIDPKMIDLAREMALHYIEWSGEKDRAEILEMTSSEGAAKFDDESLDFVFVDSYISTQDVIDHMEDWYSKVRVGGLFSGHDYNDPDVRAGVAHWREMHGIKTPVSEYDACWAWIKQQGEATCN